MSGPSPETTAWGTAALAAAVLAVDPDGLGGIAVKSRPGPVRERWLQLAANLLGRPVRKMPASTPEGRLAGGIDLAATLEAGRPVIEKGVLANADGGVLVVAMAERLAPSSAAIIAAAMDCGRVRVERDGVSAAHRALFGLLALDESTEEDEPLSPALSDRLGLRVDLDRVDWRETDGGFDADEVAAARSLLASVVVPDTLIGALCAAAGEIAAPSLRTDLNLVRAARALAALRGALEATAEDAMTALRLVLGIEFSAPAEDERPTEHPEQPRDRAEDNSNRSESDAAVALDDLLVEAVRAALPQVMLDAFIERSRARRRGATGKAGADAAGTRRGRRIGETARAPYAGARPDLLATLRQAAPWQKIRPRGAGNSRLSIRKADFRYRRLREKTGTVAIFAVDASGSTALERLGEAKGAVELLLGQCYVRRDSVALIAFRGGNAETLLQPTRSLARAKRSLGSLPGGGGTPLAAGIGAALRLAMAADRQGQSVVTIFLTDGRGNVSLDGGTQRETVATEIAMLARQFRASGMRSLLIDTAQRPQQRARDLARDLGGEYIALPHGRSQALARAVDARLAG